MKNGVEDMKKSATNERLTKFYSDSLKAHILATTSSLFQDVDDLGKEPATAHQKQDGGGVCFYLSLLCFVAGVGGRLWPPSPVHASP